MRKNFFEGTLQAFVVESTGEQSSQDPNVGEVRKEKMGWGGSGKDMKTRAAGQRGPKKGRA